MSPRGLSQKSCQYITGKTNWKQPFYGNLVKSDILQDSTSEPSSLVDSEGVHHNPMENEGVHHNPMEDEGVHYNPMGSKGVHTVVVLKYIKSLFPSCIQVEKKMIKRVGLSCPPKNFEIWLGSALRRIKEPNARHAERAYPSLTPSHRRQRRCVFM